MYLREQRRQRAANRWYRRSHPVPNQGSEPEEDEQPNQGDQPPPPPPAGNPNPPPGRPEAPREGSAAEADIHPIPEEGAQGGGGPDREGFVGVPLGPPPTYHESERARAKPKQNSLANVGE